MNIEAITKRGPHQLLPIWAPRWKYLLSVVQVHTTTLCMFYRKQHWVPKLFIFISCSLGEFSNGFWNWPDSRVFFVFLFYDKIKPISGHN